MVDDVGEAKDPNGRFGKAGPPRNRPTAFGKTRRQLHFGGYRNSGGEFMSILGNIVSSIFHHASTSASAAPAGAPS
ncbi:MAG: hypothetical protein WAK55_27570, partial [Xanthobacteraceae bacterium]